ncbi:SRPBCC family protein [Paenarthrobacter nitroguajacolicus]|uniref:SRPBCC family protein n=1 Tax=Paenarthrobacter nitroguajacolicus TaxID=211146 RepID=UPI003418C38C
MILENSFNVPTDIDNAWALLLDVERVASCMPGAVLDSVDGDDVAGHVRVKVGAIQMAYKMKGRFIERDEVNRRVVIEGAGKENRGAGTVNATVTLTLTPNGDTTDAHVTTDLAITGRPAQFGRGALEDISSKIVGQFAKNLALESRNTGAVPDTEESKPQEPGETEPMADAESAAATTFSAAPSSSTTTRRQIENEPLDLVSVLAPEPAQIVKFAAAVLLAVLAGVLLFRNCKRNLKRN